MLKLCVQETGRVRVLAGGWLALVVAAVFASTLSACGDSPTPHGGHTAVSDLEEEDPGLEPAIVSDGSGTEPQESRGVVGDSGSTAAASVYSFAGMSSAIAEVRVSDVLPERPSYLPGLEQTTITPVLMTVLQHIHNDEEPDAEVYVVPVLNEPQDSQSGDSARRTLVLDSELDRPMGMAFLKLEPQEKADGIPWLSDLWQEAKSCSDEGHVCHVATLKGWYEYSGDRAFSNLEQSSVSRSELREEIQSALVAQNRKR